MSKYGVISGPCFPVFSPNTGKYGPEITPYMDTFHTVYMIYLARFGGPVRKNFIGININMSQNIW